MKLEVYFFHAKKFIQNLIRSNKNNKTFTQECKSTKFCARKVPKTYTKERNILFVRLKKNNK